MLRTTGNEHLMSTSYNASVVASRQSGYPASVMICKQVDLLLLKARHSSPNPLQPSVFQSEGKRSCTAWYYNGMWYMGRN
jgi:hypothetical protein